MCSIMRKLERWRGETNCRPGEENCLGIYKHSVPPPAPTLTTNNIIEMSPAAGILLPATPLLLAAVTQFQYFSLQLQSIVGIGWNLGCIIYNKHKPSLYFRRLGDIRNKYFKFIKLGCENLQIYRSLEVDMTFIIWWNWKKNIQYMYS